LEGLMILGYQSDRHRNRVTDSVTTLSYARGCSANLSVVVAWTHGSKSILGEGCNLITTYKRRWCLLFSGMSNASLTEIFMFTLTRCNDVTRRCLCRVLKFRPNYYLSSLLSLFWTPQYHPVQIISTHAI
jgi:hypothetical protein